VTLSKDPFPNLALVQRSGNFTTGSNLVAFVYELLRDHVLPGDMMKVVNDSDIEHTNDIDYEKPMWRLSNGWLAQFARDIVRRLILSERERDAFKFVVAVLYKLDPNILTDEEKVWRGKAIVRLNRFINDV